MNKKKSPGQVAAIVFVIWVLVKKIAAQVSQKIHGEYSIFVDCSKSLDEMVALGHYCTVDEDVTVESFPVDEKIKADVSMRLFYFHKGMPTDRVCILDDGVKVQMDKEGWKPASIWHLLFFGAKYPKLQKKFTIIALGSSCMGKVPFLGWGGIEGDRRYLRLINSGYGWYSYCRFLAVRK